MLDLLDGAAERLGHPGIVLDWDPDLDQSLTGKVVVGSGGRLTRAFPTCSTRTRRSGFSGGSRLRRNSLSEREMAVIADTDRRRRLREKWVLVPQVMAEQARHPDLKLLTAIDALQRRPDQQHGRGRPAGWTSRAKLGSPTVNR